MPGAPERPSLSRRQRDALRAVRAFAARHGMPPTRAELGRALGVSAQTADFHLRALERKGYLELGRKARAVRAARQAAPQARPQAALQPTQQAAPPRAEAPAPVPLLGRVAAGLPSAALEDAEALLAPPAGCRADFALRVEGDSMRDAGILDGDLVFVRRDPDARDGDVVVAVLGEGEWREATVKRLRRRGRQVVLEAANPDYADREVTRGDGFALAGRVVALQRAWGRR